MEPTEAQAADELYPPSRNAEILANNMEKTAWARSPTATPRIIWRRELAKFEKTVEAREPLTKLGIDTNHVANGVYLPQTKTAAAGASAEYHFSVHMEQYFINLKKRLEFAVKKGGPTADALYDMLETNDEILPLIFGARKTNTSPTAR